LIFDLLTASVALLLSIALMWGCGEAIDQENKHEKANLIDRSQFDSRLCGTPCETLATTHQKEG